MPVALRALGAREAARLEQLVEPARSQAFRQAWAAHEARGKCHGTGLWAGRSPGREAPLVTIALPAAGGAGAALATEREPARVRCWSLAPAGALAVP